MTDKDLKKLRRSELYEVIAQLRKELDELKGGDTAPAAAELTAEQKIKEYRRRTAVTAVTCIVAAAAVIVLISEFFLPAYKVTGQSMAPTLNSGSTVLCSRYSVPDRGDVAAVELNGKILIKRIIGVSGDVISIDADGRVTLNGELLDEPYVSEISPGECDIEFPYTVPDGRYFVMGDNRGASVDSRSSAVGCVPAEFITGKVFFRLSPLGKVK